MAMNDTKAIAFLNETARYFEKRPTGGEDVAHWANVQNAENCREVAALVKRLQDILDTRPAINAGLPESYIKWSQGIYVVEAREAMGAPTQ